MHHRRTRATVALVLSLLFTLTAWQRLHAAEALPGQQPAVASSPSSQSLSGSPEEATRLQQEADGHVQAGQLKEAAEKTERALAILKQHVGEVHPDVASSIGRLGNIAFRQGQYERAESLVSDALRIREETLGPYHLDVAESLSDLASILQQRGDYVRPEPLYQRALAILEKSSSSTPTSVPASDVETRVAGVLNNLALLYDRRGDYARAESHYLRALAIRERTRGPDDAIVARTLANLGGVYYASKQYEKAVQVLRRALRIQDERKEPSATTNSTLAAVFFDQGDFQSAETFFRRALAIDERTLDPQHPTLAIRLVNLAEVLRLKGEYAAAEPLYERALSIRERKLGATHPEVAHTLIARSLLLYAKGDADGAAELLSRGAELREETLVHVMTTGSEADKRLYLRTLVNETDIAISLHLGSAPSSTPAARLALTNILQRKGRSIDAMTDQMASLRRRLDETDRKVLTQLSDARARLARTVLRGVETEAQQQSLAALRSEVQRLEQTLGARSAEFMVATKTATLGEIQEALPSGAALIEFVSYRPFSVRIAPETAFGAPRYAAYVLRNEGIVAAIDLGEAAVIDRQVERFRGALSRPAHRDTRAAARALHQAVMAPIAASLRDVPRIIVSPDGALNLIPFAALIGADDKYLVEDFTISYMTSGRDLVRFAQAGRPPRKTGPPSIVANPAFGSLRTASVALPDGPGPTRALPAPSELQRGLRFVPLPGTAQEATALAKMLPDARVYTGTDASEGLLKQLSAPSILHIASHGFFLRPRAALQGTTSRGATAPAPADAGSDREDALVLSGLALAGANERGGGTGEDGILTALEVAGLDLWGTRMVVLSACETGLGEARDGEGVYGLRRALVLAGSDSQVMSLWKVADDATRDLMIGFYQRLRSGEGPADALRNVQLSLLRGGPTRAHPFFWASFIQSGDWRAFD